MQTLKALSQILYPNIPKYSFRNKQNLTTEIHHAERIFLNIQPYLRIKKLYGALSLCILSKNIIVPQRRERGGI